ncbi:MAG: PqqD family protein [Campylobacterota bacterium]
MNLNHKIQFPDTIFAQEVDGEMVLLDMASENYFGLDAVGSDIWQLLQEGKTLQEANDALIEMYDVSPEQLKIDIVEFVQKLIDAGLVQVQA